MSGTEDLTLPDLRRMPPGSEPPRKIGVGRISRVVEEVSVPGLPEHLVMVNVGRPYRLEERLDGRVYRTFGVKGDPWALVSPVLARVLRRRAARDLRKLQTLLDHGG